MQFDSFTFFAFFLLVLAIYHVLPTWNARKTFLLVASYVFYSAWNPPFVLLLIASTTLDWWIAHRIAAASGRTRKAWIVATLAVNLAVLGYFKYSQFALENFAALLGTMGIQYVPAKLDIVLPIGISFYTFHSLSYCLDVYRRKFAPTNSWRDYALYVTFFPQLVAGPIVRFTQMRDQIETPRGTTAAGLGLGMTLLAFGLFEKIVLADGVFAPVADALFNAPQAASPVLAWGGTLAFAGQIFCDFAGYTNCALGAALALGFALPINFRNPYAAIGFSDFWRRWHVSLSTWLRDYLYVSLGGNRHGLRRTYIALMLTMLIGGLWHGASWTFVVWGGLHGVYLCLERALRAPVEAAGWHERAPMRAAYGAFTFLVVALAWVWFRATDFSAGWLIHTKLMDFPAAIAGIAKAGSDLHIALIAMAGLVAVQWIFRSRDLRQILAELPPWLLVPLLAAMLVLIVLSPGENHAFIYFQF